jgi:predicted amidohydrolase
VDPTKVAVAQLALAVAEPDANRQAAADAIAEAAAAGARLVVLPELCDSGYVFAPQDPAAEARGLAAPAAGNPTLDQWHALAVQHGLVIVGGFCELGDDGLVYNSAALVDASGTRAVYRKAHLWDKEKFVFTPGDAAPPVVDTEAGRVAVMVCYDLEFPEWTRLAALEGADLIAAPVNWPGYRWPEGERPAEVVKAQAAAASNGVFVAVCDRSGVERGVPWISGSLIASPEGYLLAGPVLADRPVVLTADCDLPRARNKRVSENNDLLADRRPELYAAIQKPLSGVLSQLARSQLTLSELGGQQRDGRDLLLGQVVPVDAGRRARPGSAALDHPVRRDDEVQRHVVAGQRDGPGLTDLELMHRGDADGIRPDQAGRGGQRELQVSEPAALAQPGAVLRGRHAAHHHQVDRGHFGQRHPARRAGRAADRGRLARRLGQVSRVEGEERLGLGQPRHGHVHGLAVLQGTLAHRPLGGVRVGLHGARALPGGQGAQAFRGGLGPGEVRDAPGGAREPGHLGRAHRGPYLLPQRRLRGQQLGGTAGVAVVPGRGTSHAAYPAVRRGPARAVPVRRAARPGGSRPSA